jgi:ubiquinone/menaquinone biosynthesis C-methylase UbiE
MRIRTRLAALVGLTGVAVGVLWWRNSSRGRHLPCPAWLGWILENPYSDWIAGSRLLLDRAGVEAGMRVLDAGAGTGRVALAAAERVGSIGEVVALDLQPRMLAQVRQKASERGLVNVRTVAGSIESADPLQGAYAGYFDRAFLVTVLGEVPDRVAGLRTLYGLLRPEGILSVTEFLPDPHYQSRATVRQLAAEAGFRPGAAFGGGFAFTLNLHKRRA